MSLLKVKYFNSICTLFVGMGLIIGFIVMSKRHEQALLSRDRITGNQVARELDEYYFSKVLDILSFAVDSRDVVEMVTIGRSKNFEEHLEIISKFFTKSVTYLMNVDGDVVASGVFNDNGDTLTGNNFIFRPYFYELKNKDYVVYPAAGIVTKTRGLYFSRGVYSDGVFVGALVLKLPVDTIEERLNSISGLNVALMTPDGIIFASNNSKYLFKTFFDISDERMRKIEHDREFADNQIDKIGMITRDTLNIDGIDYKYQVLSEGYSGWKLLVFNEESLYALDKGGFVLFGIIATLSVLLLIFIIKYRNLSVNG